MPTLITNLVATVSGSTVTLTWVNPTDTARNLVFRDGKMIDDTDTGITSYVDTNVAAGTHSYQVVPIGDTATLAVTVGTVTPPPALVLGGVASQTTTEGTAITPIDLSASGGTAPYAFAISGEPAGVTEAGGVITGTPTAAGSFSVTVTVTDSGSPEQTASGTFAMTVATPVTPPPSGVTITNPAVSGTVPPVRGEPGGAYHPGTGLIYFANGNSNAGQLMDTYSFNPVTGAWAKLTVTLPGNTAISMGYDPVTKKLILFGGDNDSTTSNSTYALDPTVASPAWTKLSPATVPPARTGHCCFNDPITGELMIYGGNVLGQAAALDDCWKWTGTNWVEVSSAFTGTGRTGAFAGTLTNGIAVIFGGNGSGLFSDTHVWNGTTCTKANPATSPPARRFGGGAPTNDGRFLIYGGCNADFSVNESDCWIWDGTNWTKQTPAGVNPGGLSSQWMVAHPPTGKLIMAFGTAGASASSMSSDINTVYEFTVGGSVTPPPPAGLSITTTTLPGGTVGTAYSATLAGSGGTGAESWSATELPAGLSLSPLGVIAGTPTETGTSSVVVTLKDSNNDTPATATFSVTIVPAGVTPPPPTGSAFYGTAVNNGWGNVPAGEASAAKLGSSVVMFGDYWATGGYPFSTIATMPFPKFLLTTHLWASSGEYTMAQFLADLKTANSTQLASFVSIAAGMKSTGKECIIRLSAEPEGQWEPDWAVNDPADYSACLDIIIPAMVAEFPALEFTLDFDNGWFNTSAGTEFNPATLYSTAVLDLPQVKYVGMDTYAEFWGTVPSGQTMSEADWNQLLTNQYGLQWLQAFAEAHNLQVGISEFGPSIRTSGSQVVGTGDDPYYITQFFDWFNGLGTTAGFVCFFDCDASDGNHQITGGDFPNSLAAAQAAIA